MAGEREGRERVLGVDVSKLTELIDVETEASEATRDQPSRGVKRREGTSAVYSLRLPADKIARLQELAAAIGVPPTVLLRTWVIERLDEGAETRLRGLIHAEVRDAVREAMARS